MDPPLSPTKIKINSLKLRISELVTPILNIYPQYQQKLNLLGLPNQLIITNPKQFVNLFESKQLNQQAVKQKYYAAWSSICQLLIHLFKIMPINATFIYNSAFFAISLEAYMELSQSYRTVNVVEYIIVKIFSFLDDERKIKQKFNQQDEQEQKLRLSGVIKKITEATERLFILYHFFIQNCCVEMKSLKMITQLLCNRFYASKLTVNMLKITYSMFSQVNDSTISPTDSGNSQPFIFFNGSAKIGLRLLLTNNKWPFNKGMHLCIWMKSFIQIQSANNYLVLLKVDEKNWFVIRQDRTQLVIQSSVLGEKYKRKICDFPIRELVKFQLVTEPKQSGLFKSSVQYRLHLRINGLQTKNVEIKMPRFDSSDFVTQFNMFGEYVGQFYTICLWKSTNSYAALKDGLPDKLDSQIEVNNFVESIPELVEDLLTILSPLRVFKGILVNMINSEYNHACHQATMLLKGVQNRSIRYLASFSQILLPYLYFTCKIWRQSMQSSGQEEQQTKFECQKFFNILIQEYCRSRQEYSQLVRIDKRIIKTRNKVLQNYKQTILYILYWIEAMDYHISEITLKAIFELLLNCAENSQPLFMKYLDKNMLMSKNIKATQIYCKLKSKIDRKNNVGSFSFGEEQECNPVTKIQLLFYIETAWKELWNKYQYMTQWWEPLDLKMQKDKPFDYSDYVFKEIQNKKQSKELVTKPLVEWYVSEFVTNDFCDCLILPLILDPHYIKLGEAQNGKPSPFIFNKFQQLYTKKQCMIQPFDEPQLILSYFDKQQPNKYYFKKIVQSIFGRIIGKISKQKSEQGEARFEFSGRKVLKAFTNEDESKVIKYECEASYLTLLTLIIGTITIEVKGKSSYISFSQRHFEKFLDHICIKPFKNEEFYYICIDLADVRVIKKRRFNQTMNGLEIRLKSGHGYLFYFHQKNIDKFIGFLNQNFKNVKNGIQTVFKDPYDEYLASNQTTLWIDKKISNWQYLQWLNDIAGRSYTDITQYPVLPWVFIQNQKNPQIVTSQTNSFRDLAKNMGSFGPKQRIQHFLEKYRSVGEGQIFSQYHFGTHYSSSAIIFNYLIRLRPFSVGAVTLQSGKFDCADRVFSSYMGSWVNATNSPTDLRELIPQIFMLPEMMININGYDFGFTQLKQRICNVDIPKWASKNPYSFCKYLRKTLQNELVSQKINNWIDLIYGYKQKGPAAVQSMNIFFPLTYQLAINVDKVSDPQEKLSIETQIAHFGQNPAQIIGSSPHPLRSTKKQKWENKLLADCNQIIIQKCSLTRMNIGEVKFIYQSVFQDKNSILSIKFLTENVFIVLRRYQFCLFKILDNKSGFISKEKEIQFVTQKDNISLDYQNISTYVPMVTIIYQNSKSEDDGLVGISNLAVVGGFYNGTLQIIYLNDVKSSGVIKMPFHTVTALAYSQQFNFLYVGDSQGVLGVYQLYVKNPNSPSKQLEFTERFHQQIHDGKINNISISKSANLFVTCSQDGTVKLFNLYSQQQYRKISNPSKYPVIFARISTCPLYCIVFYSEQNSSLYSYSINGQFISSFEDTTGFLYNISISSATNHCQYLIYLNAQRQILILELPQLKSKKRIRLKKDEFKISCFETTNQIAIAGSQDGALQIIADPSSF